MPRQGIEAYATMPVPQHAVWSGRCWARAPVNAGRHGPFAKRMNSLRDTVPFSLVSSGSVALLFSLMISRDTMRIARLLNQGRRSLHSTTWAGRDSELGRLKVSEPDPAGTVILPQLHSPLSYCTMEGFALCMIGCRN
jgi:hypothetical protein